MRKTWKRALSYVLSAAMVLTAGVFAPADKTAKAADSEPKFTAELWSFGTFAGWTSDPSATVEVDGAKEYTITADATEDLDDLFTSDNGTAVVLGNYADLTAAGLGTAYQVVGKSIKVNDGEDIPWVTEAVEWDATARLVINNAWNPELDFATSVKQPIKAGDKISVTFEVKAGGSSTTPSDPTTAPVDPEPTDKMFNAHLASFGTIWGWVDDPDGKNATPGAWSVDVTGAGEYTVTAEATNDCDSSGAALVVNTNLKALPSGYTLVGKTFKINDKEYDWSKAEAYLDGTYYRLSIWNEWGDEKANPIGQDLEINAGDKIEATFAVVETKPLFTAHLASFGTIWGWTGDDYGKPATPGAWQIDVTGAGDYTVSGEATNDCDSSGGVLAVLTTLKEVPTDYAIVGKTLKVNDKVYDWSKAQAYLDGDYVRISVWNEWGDEKANTISEDIEINAGDKVEATISVVEPQKPVDPVDPQPPVVTKKVLGTAKGKTFTAGNFKYKVTTAATIEGTKKTAGKVTVVGLSSAGKKKTSINVKNTVSVKSTGASYKVTAIGSKAFKNASKLKSATLGTNIKSIPASAFAGCKKLSKLSVKKTLSSVKKNAFKGCKKTIKVTGGSKKVNKANVKKLKKSGYKKFK